MWQFFPCKIQDSTPYSTYYVLRNSLGQNNLLWQQWVLRYSKFDGGVFYYGLYNISFAKSEFWSKFFATLLVICRMARMIFSMYWRSATVLQPDTSQEIKKPSSKQECVQWSWHWRYCLDSWASVSLSTLWENVFLRIKYDFGWFYNPQIRILILIPNSCKM